jgi:tRNA pseudouridine38-40 synthase
MLTRFALGLEYDGTDFVGWQAQQNGRSVEATLAAAISRVADEPIAVRAAGRTDAGVHASLQVVHFDTAAVRSARQWRLGINSNLPPDIAVHWIAPVSSDFDARRSALARRYRYRIHCSETRAALARRRVWWIREPLDPAAMTAAAVRWLGERDFSAFRAANCQSTTPMRRMLAIAIRVAGAEIAIDFTANAFLYHMVRNLVGVLAEIGKGRARPGWAGELLERRDRTLAAMTAPACGLTLVDVAYPARFGLPVEAESAIMRSPESASRR